MIVTGPWSPEESAWARDCLNERVPLWEIAVMCDRDKADVERELAPVLERGTTALAILTAYRGGFTRREIAVTTGADADLIEAVIAAEDCCEPFKSAGRAASVGR